MKIGSPYYFQLTVRILKKTSGGISCNRNIYAKHEGTSKTTVTRVENRNETFHARQKVHVMNIL